MATTAVMCILLVAIFFCFRRFSTVPSALQYLLASWVIILGIDALQFVNYGSDLDYSTVLLIVGSLFAFASGCAIAKLASPKFTRITSAEASIERQVYLALVVLPALLFVILVAAKVISGQGGWMLRADFSELQEAREAHWDAFDAAGEQSLWDKILSPFRSAAFLAAVSAVHFWRGRTTWLVMVALISFFGIAIESLSIGGRAAIVFTALAIAITWKSTLGTGPRGSNLGGRLLEAGALCIALWASLVWFPMMRNPDLGANVSSYLRYLVNAELSDYVRALDERPNFLWVSVLAYSSSYFSSPIHTLDFFYRQTDACAWYEMGRYNFALSARLFELLGFTGTNFVEIRLDIAELLARFNRSENPWATGIRDFCIDFGIGGGLIGIFLFGYVAELALLYCRARRGIFADALSAIVRLACVIFPFLSPFVLPIISNSIVYIIALFFLTWIGARKIPKLISRWPRPYIEPKRR